VGAVELGRLFGALGCKDESCFACGIAEKGSTPKVELDDNPLPKGTNPLESLTDDCEGIMFKLVEFALAGVVAPGVCEL
jgi:hypothetical protein